MINKLYFILRCSKGELIHMSYLLKVFLFLLGVGVVEAHDELAFECDLIVLVEQSSLGVADVQVSGHRRIENWSLLIQLLSHHREDKSLLNSQSKRTHWPPEGIEPPLCPSQPLANPQTSQHLASCHPTVNQGQKASK